MAKKQRTPGGNLANLDGMYGICFTIPWRWLEYWDEFSSCFTDGTILCSDQRSVWPAKPIGVNKYGVECCLHGTSEHIPGYAGEEYYNGVELPHDLVELCNPFWMHGEEQYAKYAREIINNEVFNNDIDKLFRSE